MLTLSDHSYSLQNRFAANAKPLLFSTQKCACTQPKLAQTQLVDVARAISGLQTETRRPETSGLPIRFCIFTGITLYTDVSAITSVYPHIKKQHLSLKILLLLLLKVIIIISITIIKKCSLFLRSHISLCIYKQLFFPFPIQLLVSSIYRLD